MAYRSFRCFGPFAQVVGGAALAAAVPQLSYAQGSDSLSAAKLNIDNKVEAIDFVWSGHRVNAQMIQRGDHQIIVYYDANRQMSVAHRSDQRTPWRYHKLASWVGWDSHNYVTVNVDEAGYVHVMGNMHADPLVYFRSREPWDVRSLEQVPFLVDPKREQRVTYPAFDHDPNGRLIVAFRIGGSGNGSFYFHRFDTAMKSWSLLHNGPFFEGEGERSAYYIGPSKGPDGKFHMIWVWRETPSAATNNNLSYLRSADLLNWEDSNGKPVALPVTRAKGEIVDPVPVGGGMLNGNTRLGFDAVGRPMIAYYKNDSKGDTQIMLARKSGKGWQIQQVSDWVDTKQDLDRGGSLSGNAVSVRQNPYVAKDGTIRVRASRSGKSLEFVINPVTGKTISVHPFEPSPAVLSGFKDIPGVPLQIRKAEGVPSSSSHDFYLSMQAGEPNQDQARANITPPSILRLHRLPKVTDSPDPTEE